MGFKIENGVLVDYTSEKGVTDVVIPDGVTKIGREAFVFCDSLTSVTIPGSVTEIGWNAFKGCSSLTSVTIPDSVTKIGSFAFSDCSSLTSVTIPDNVTEIGGYSFYGCSSLTSVSIPNSVTQIGYRAFYGCSSLTSVSIPNSVTQIGENAFSRTPFLENDSREFVVYGKVLYQYNRRQTNVIIPYDITTIGYRAFYKCSSLTSVTIPDGVTKIGYGAFDGCNSLKNISIFGYTVDNTQWNREKVTVEGIISMLISKDYSVKMDHPTKYQFVAQVFIKDAKPEAEAYIKKNIAKILPYFIDLDDYETVKALFESGKFVTKRNIMKFQEYAIAHTQNGGDIQIQAYITDYRNKHFPDSDPLKNMKI